MRPANGGCTAGPRYPAIVQSEGHQRDRRWQIDRRDPTPGRQVEHRNQAELWWRARWQCTCKPCRTRRWNREIEERRILVPHGGIIPRTQWDELLLINGERLLIDFIDISDNGVRFRIQQEADILTLPKHRVRSLTSRMGDVIYPKPIHLKR